MNKYSDKFRPIPNRKFGRSSSCRVFVAKLHQEPSTPQVDPAQLATVQYPRSLIKQLHESPRWLHPSPARLPSQQDFEAIIKRLDAVIEGHSPIQTCLIREGLSRPIELSRNDHLFVRIPTEEKAVPLRVQVRRNCGSLCIYASKTVKEPSQMAHDAIYKHDYFEIIEVGPLFKTPRVNLRVEALEDTRFSIEVKFGRPKPKGLDPEILRLIQLRRAILRKSMSSLRPLPKPSSPIRSDRTSWASRQQQVMAKKALALQEKKEKTIQMLNRQMLKRDQERREREEKELQRVMTRRQRTWIALLAFTQMSQALKETVDKAVAAQTLRITHTAAVRKIQAVTRRALIIDCRLLRCSYWLRLFANTTQAVQRTCSLVKFLQTAGQNNIISWHIAQFCKCVHTIEDAWKAELARRKQRWLNLVSMWNQVLHRKIANLAKSSRAKSKERLKKLVSINVPLRDQVLAKFMQDKLNAYRDAYPDHTAFQYLPTPAEMNQLLRFACQASSSAVA